MFFEKVNFKKKSTDNKKHAKLHSMQRVKVPVTVVAADDILKKYIFSVHDNKAWHFMWIVCY